MFSANETLFPESLLIDSGNLSQWNLPQRNNTLSSALYPSTGLPLWWTPVLAVMYLVTCIAGLIGNSLVIIVVLRQTRAKSVTDVYIANLAVADLCFLIGLPFLASTMLLGQWIFGSFLCRLFYMMTSINWFTSVFTLAAMSADRYLAVCHPVRAIACRTTFVACIVCTCIWIASLIAMSPIVVYATTVPQYYNRAQQTCTIRWPYDQRIDPEQAFLGYSFVLGFAVPIPLISLLYALVVVRLRTVGPKRKSRAGGDGDAPTRRKHHKVTRLVFSVVAVYICCWLPYWIFQLALMFAIMPGWYHVAFQIITLFSYANSSLNPLLYAFLNDNFRSNFLVAFRCRKNAHAHGSDRLSRMTDRKRTIESRWPDKDTSVRLASEKETSEVGAVTVVRAKGSVDDEGRKGCLNAVAKQQSKETEERETIL